MRDGSVFVNSALNQFICNKFLDNFIQLSGIFFNKFLIPIPLTKDGFCNNKIPDYKTIIVDFLILNIFARKNKAKIMRHNNKINHLGRKYAHRKALLSNMAISLIMYKRIFTTLAKAKELRKYIEPIISKSKNDTTHSRRLVFQQLHDKYAVTELFQEVSQKIGDRPGGYTRIIKIGNRLGDNASMCFIELVDYNELMLQEKATKAKAATKTRRSRRGSAKAAETENIVIADNSNLPQGAYEDVQLVRLVGFRDIYSEQKSPTIQSLLALS